MKAEDLRVLSSLAIFSKLTRKSLTFAPESMAQRQQHLSSHGESLHGVEGNPEELLVNQFGFVGSSDQIHQFSGNDFTSFRVQDVVKDVALIVYVQLLESQSKLLQCRSDERKILCHPLPPEMTTKRHNWIMPKGWSSSGRYSPVTGDFNSCPWQCHFSSLLAPIQQQQQCSLMTYPMVD